MRVLRVGPGRVGMVGIDVGAQVGHDEGRHRDVVAQDEAVNMGAQLVHAC